MRKKQQQQKTLSYHASAMFVWVKVLIEKVVFKGKDGRGDTAPNSFFFLLGTSGMKAGRGAS